MRAVRRVGACLWLSVLVGCASDAGPPAARDAAAPPSAPSEPTVPAHPTGPDPTSEPAPAPTSAPPSATAPPAPAGSTDAPPAPSAPPPLVVPGATACTPAESEQGWCAREGRGGECIDGACVTAAACPAYCGAVAVRENDCMAPIDAECAKVPACVRDTKTIHDTCKGLRRSTATDCRTHVCARIAAMPKPPVRDSRD